MKNATDYTNPLAQAACVASNLAALAREALESSVGQYVKVCEAKKGAIGIAFTGDAGNTMGHWLDAWIELDDDGNKKARDVLKSTINRESGKLKDSDGNPLYPGKLSIQRVDGVVVFVLSPPATKSEPTEDGVLVAAAKAIESSDLSPETLEALAKLLKDAAADAPIEFK